MAFADVEICLEMYQMCLYCSLSTGHLMKWKKKMKQA